MVIWSQRLKERKLRSNLNAGQMLLPLSHGALAVDYNICTSEDIKLLLGALNFLNSHYTEKALHKLAHYNNHLTLLCRDKTNYMQWLS